MDKRTINLAARIYRHSVVAQCSPVVEDEIAQAVADKAVADAKAALRRIGHGPMGYPSLDECITAAAKDPA